jgi:hypothetical protein
VWSGYSCPLPLTLILSSTIGVLICTCSPRFKQAASKACKKAKRFDVTKGPKGRQAENVTAV